MADENKQIRERNRQASKQKARQQEEGRRQADTERSNERIGKLNEERNQAIMAYILAEEEKRAKIRKEEKTFKDMQPNLVNKGTNNLLKAAWEYFGWSWGLTLIWIDIHIFLGLVLGNKMFGKLGMEWVPDFIKQTRFKEAEKIGKKIGFWEGMGAACLNLGCLMIVIAVLMIAAMILKIMENPLAFYSEYLGWMWSIASSAVVKFVSGG